MNFNFSEWVFRRQKIIYTCLSIILLAVITGASLFFYWEKREQKILAELYKIEKMMESETEEVETIVLTIEEFLDNYSNSKQVKLLQFYLAQFYTENSMYQEAISILEEIILIYDEEDTVVILSNILLASLYQENKEFDKAIETLDTLNIQLLDDYIIFELAQNYLLKGDIESAKTRFLGILQDFPQTSLKPTIEEILRII